MKLSLLGKCELCGYQAGIFNTTGALCEKCRKENPDYVSSNNNGITRSDLIHLSLASIISLLACIIFDLSLNTEHGDFVFSMFAPGIITAITFSGGFHGSGDGVYFAGIVLQVLLCYFLIVKFYKWII